MRSSFLLDRRAFLAGTAAALIAAEAPDPLLDRAIRRAGGEAALRRVRALRWEGEARILAATPVIEIGVSTRVEPFRAARSDTWLLRDGPTKPRSLILDGANGWVERNGTRTAMPAAMAQHERAQYALYGLMLLVTLRDPGASARPGKQAATIIASHPGAPETILGFDGDDHLAWAANAVPDPDGGGTIDQRFSFSGEIVDRDVRWPRRIAIEQAGKPYFELRIDRFGVEI